MKRRKLGDEFQAIYYAIKNSQDAIGKLEAVIHVDWKTKKAGKYPPEQWKKFLQFPEIEKEFRQRLHEQGEKNIKKFRKELERQKKELAKEIGGKDVWADAAMRLHQRGELLFDREKLLDNLPSEFRRKIYEMTIQLMHGYQELVANWEDEHAKWLKEKDEWEEDNPEYMKVRPIFEAFQKEKGKVKGSRIRWFDYLDFLSSHPDLANWRGKASEIVPLSSEERKGLRKPREHFEAFFEKNPELRELDRKHKY